MAHASFMLDLLEFVLFDFSVQSAFRNAQFIGCFFAFAVVFVEGALDHFDFLGFQTKGFTCAGVGNRVLEFIFIILM